MFKVGDKVKIVNPYFIDEIYKGDVVTIIKIEESPFPQTRPRYFVKENSRPWVERELKLVEEFKMKKEDLKNEDIVTLRNGDRQIFDGYSLIDLSDDNNNFVCDISDLNDDLTCDECEDYDVIKVERPVKYETVFEREDVKELTVDEISKRLGYKVKVVGMEK
jgi:hypothetical protein